MEISLLLTRNERREGGKAGGIFWCNIRGYFRLSEFRRFGFFLPVRVALVRGGSEGRGGDGRDE